MWVLVIRCVAVAASTHGRRRGEALAFFFFRHGERYVQLGGEDDRVQGVVMVYSRATRGAGIVIHVIRSVVVDTGQPTERARSCGFQVRVILL